MSAKLAFPPLPIEPGVSYGKPGYQDWAFNLSDAEGMYNGTLGPRKHGAVDWFANGGTQVKAARTGWVVENRPSRGITGQVFGGVVKIREDDGTVWVYRHVSPYVQLGVRMEAGEMIALVTPWLGGPDHLHMEIWKTLAGGYNFANAIDPKSYTYTLAYQGKDDRDLPQRLRDAGYSPKAVKRIIYRLRKGIEGSKPNPNDSTMFANLRREGLSADSARAVIHALRED